MTTTTTTSFPRQIFKSAATCREEVRDLIQLLFTCELLAPSRCLWLVSPWITDLEVIDNREGGFSALEPTWGARAIRLTEVLSRMTDHGTVLRIAMRPVANAPANADVARKLSDLGARLANPDQLHVIEREELHTKGLLGDDYFLAGSMNFTRSGVEVWDERVELHTDRVQVLQAMLEMHGRYPGTLPPPDEADA
jgi:hypothetical protein